jgi:hypothetical protein
MAQGVAHLGELWASSFDAWVGFFEAEVAYMQPLAPGDPMPPSPPAPAAWVAKALALAGPAATESPPPPLTPGRGLFALTAADPPGQVLPAAENAAR